MIGNDNGNSCDENSNDEDECTKVKKYSYPSVTISTKELILRITDYSYFD